MTKHLAVVIPVFNDWTSVATLLADIDRVLRSAGFTASVVVVDDGSTTAAAAIDPGPALKSVRIAKLRCNVGHQRAIAVGLWYVTKGMSEGFDAVVVMDGDGEDQPEDIPGLVQGLLNGSSAVFVMFAARTKRLESLPFRALYRIYRALHWLLTGVSVRVGNFSALRPEVLPRLLMASESWNHYAAAVFRSRIPFAAIPVARGKRYSGASHMRYSDLAAHGLSAIAVFSANVGARLILLLSALIALCTIGLISAAAFGLFKEGLLLDRWGLTLGVVLIIFLLQTVLTLLFLVLVVLGDRSHMKVIPWRDAELFLDSVETVRGPRA